MLLAEVGVKCPRCGMQFNSTIPESVFDTGLRDSELRCVPAPGEQPFEPLVVCACPGCGKADWTLSFNPGSQLFGARETPTPSYSRFAQAAREAQDSGGSSYSLSMYYLYAAWCADDAGAPAAGEYRRLSAELLTRSLADQSCPLFQRATVEYLIGEIQRRRGAFTECLRHFKEVIPRLPARYAFMARKLMRLAELSMSDPVPFDSEGV
jgi:hypothetical protein